jgi:hypothetical protein
MKSLTVIWALLLLAGCGATPAREQTQEQSAPAAQKAPDDNAAVAAIARINAAQKDFFARNRRYALTYEELMQAFLLKEEPTMAKTGYDIRLRPSADAASYTVVAIPSAPLPATRSFFSDQTGDIRGEQGKDATAQSPKISP